MALEGNKDGSAGGTKQFWWPCPTCRLWHQTRLPVELLEKDVVSVRCPVGGRLVERPVAHSRAAKRLPLPRPGLLRRIFRRVRGSG